jgi:TatA/E family protein of Tat protein translocase
VAAFPGAGPHQAAPQPLRKEVGYALWPVGDERTAVLFGASRLPEIGRGLGLGIKRFKRALHEDEDNIKKKELDDD